MIWYWTYGDGVGGREGFRLKLGVCEREVGKDWGSWNVTMGLGLIVVGFRRETDVDGMGGCG